MKVSYFPVLHTWLTFTAATSCVNLRYGTFGASWADSLVANGFPFPASADSAGVRVPGIAILHIKVFIADNRVQDQSPHSRRTQVRDCTGRYLQLVQWRQISSLQVRGTARDCSAKYIQLFAMTTDRKDKYSRSFCS